MQEYNNEYYQIQEETDEFLFDPNCPRLEGLKSRYRAYSVVPYDSVVKVDISPVKAQELQNQAVKAYSNELVSKRRKAERSEVSEAEGVGGLSINKQVGQKKKIALYNRHTKRYTIIDPEKLKLSTMKKRVLTAVTAVNDLMHLTKNMDVVYVVQSWTHHFYTLTYDYEKTPPKKGDIEKLMNVWKKDINRQFSKVNNVERLTDYLSIIWTKEYTKKDGLHYHILLSTPKGILLPKFFLDGGKPKETRKIKAGKESNVRMKKMWNWGWSTYGTKDGSTIKSVGYIAKYISKEISKESLEHKGWRTFAISEPKKIFHETKLPISPKNYLKFKKLPAWLQLKVASRIKGYITKTVENIDAFDRLDVVKVSGGWVVNNIFYESPFEFGGFDIGGLKEEEIEQEKFDLVEHTFQLACNETKVFDY